MVGAGVPVAVTVKEKALSVVAVALGAEVKAGLGLTDVTLWDTDPDDPEKFGSEP
jgi:hypothetical protein